MNAKLELWKIRLQAYNERYTALTILTLTLSSTMPKNQDDANLTNKTLATPGILRQETLEQINLVEQEILKLAEKD